LDVCPNSPPLVVLVELHVLLLLSVADSEGGGADETAVGRQVHSGCAVEVD
jgi:hypothetical protein